MRAEDVREGEFGDNNPLVRRIDIVEARQLRMSLLVTALLLALTVALGTAVATVDASTAPATTTITAVTRASTTATPPTGRGMGPYVDNRVMADWVWDGHARSGPVLAPPFTSAGASVRVSVDADGNPVTPGGGTEPSSTLPLLVVVMVGMILVGSLLTRRSIRARCDRHRDAQWDRALAGLYGS